MQDIREIEFAEYGVSDFHPLTIAFTIAMGLVLLSVRRPFAVVPLALVLTLVPSTHRIVIGGLDFTMIRITIAFVWMRLIAFGELRPLRLLNVDKLLLAFVLSKALFYTLRVGSPGAAIYQAGNTFDSLGLYFGLRLLLRTPGDIVRGVRCLAWISVPIALFMFTEKVTGRNLFSVLGGVPWETWVRDGSLRARGAFAHAILAGTFGAVLFPLFAGLWIADRRSRLVATLGMASGVVIAFTASSSGAVMALGSAFIAWSIWPVRRHTTTIRRSIFAGAVFIHFAREQPIWQLIGRVSNLTGGTGWHRVRLIDAFVYYWGEWIAMGTNSVAHWGWGLQDLTNEFVLVGVRGGIVPLVFFVWWIVASFASIGRSMRLVQRVHRSFPGRRGPSLDAVAHPAILWGLGVCLLAHVVSFISVSYFGQLRYVFFLTMSLIAVAESGAVAGVRVSHRESPRSPGPVSRSPRLA
jgi:hypothetical protein